MFSPKRKEKKETNSMLDTSETASENFALKYQLCDKKKFEVQLVEHQIPLSPYCDYASLTSTSCFLKSNFSFPWYTIEPNVLKNTSIGVWSSKYNSVALVHSRGAFLHRSVNKFLMTFKEKENVICLHSEEALFCMERGLLRVFDGKTGELISIQDFYERLFAKKDSNLNEINADHFMKIMYAAYTAYSFLRRKGFSLKRTRVTNEVVNLQHFGKHVVKLDDDILTTWNNLKQYLNSSTIYNIHDNPPVKKTDISSTSFVCEQIYDKKVLTCPLGIDSQSVNSWTVHFQKKLYEKNSSDVLQMESKAKINSANKVVLRAIDPDTTLNAFFDEMRKNKENKVMDHVTLFGLAAGTAQPVFLIGHPLLLDEKF
jgi:hypothetical protein